MNNSHAGKSVFPFFLFIFAAGMSFAQSNWFMAQTEKAVAASVLATSELVEAQFSGKYLYPPINVLDGDFATVWCEAEKMDRESERRLRLSLQNQSVLTKYKSSMGLLTKIIMQKITA